MLAWKEGWGVFAVGEFVAYVAAGVEAWGKPFQIVVDRYSHVVWKYPQNVIADLIRYEAYSQATCQPVKPLVRARLRMAVNKPL